jgi:hypothetical protein
MGGFFGVSCSGDKDREHIVLSSQKDLHLGLLRVYKVDYSLKCLKEVGSLDA